KLHATGRITTDGRRLMYNPRYALVAAD
ncbi:MAG: hypothetical protein QOJ03_1325, partial [Frankiaceae bacterium]|nr:hypothetical protein [Frankiaceae bacterium]